MKKPYNHERIETKWQKVWDRTKLYTVNNKVKGKKNEMLLVEFPYPSGNLHVGHWYAFALPDIYARFRRMSGINVLYPIGFDAFGLPAENAAIKNKVNPKTWTYKNMAHMRKQIASMGTMFDWSREVVTCDPGYYKWTQSLFLELYKKGLVYRKPTIANWCPGCKTVLANEQVTAGHCERCGSAVEQREMPQWNIAITKYADRLVDDLDTLAWPDAIKESQKNWIGRSEGHIVDFRLQIADNRLANEDTESSRENSLVEPAVRLSLVTLQATRGLFREKLSGAEFITVFTTRVDTIFGATFIVLAPEHPLLASLEHVLQNKDEVRDYQYQTAKKSDLERQETKDKTGVRLVGVEALNPATGKPLPIFIADYVLAHYGTGAVMAVPAHDERDHAFAKKYELPVVEVVQGDGVLTNSAQFTGQKASEAKSAIATFVGAKTKKTYRLRDWVVSRQRYWGVPIPMVYCEHCHTKEREALAAGKMKKNAVITGGYHPVPDKQLPVVLPRVTDYLPTGEGKSPLAKASRWVKTKCPDCGKTATRETDTLDTFVCSSWYYLRYTDPKNRKKIADKQALSAWIPVALYSGGAEHTTMHLLYSRFWHKVLYDRKLVPGKEPYTRRLNRGIILGPDGQKMSKSKGNVVDPDEVVTRLGTDTVRMYLAFIGPYNEVGSYPWNFDSIAGVRRFLERVWKIEPYAGKTSEDLERELHKTIKKVTDDVGKLQHNTAIAALMSLLNAVEKETATGVPRGLSHTDYATLLRLLAPFAPHITEELWAQLGKKGSIHTESWPTYNKRKLVSATMTLPVQVNGKVRANIQVATDAAQDDILAAAKLGAAAALAGQAIVKEIYIPGKIVSLVVTPQ